MKSRNLPFLARLVASAILATSALIACTSSSDGPIMSDEEKLKKFEQGHSAYGGNKAAPKGPN